MSAGLDEIASSISAARKAKKLTQKALGERVGLPQSHISKIEKGLVNLQLSSLVEIARALDLELSLIPRSALPAVEAVMRGQFASPQLPEPSERALPRPAFRLEDDEE